MSGFPRSVLLGFAVAFVAVVATSWIVGTVGTETGFDWELAAIFGTALGTTLLAVTTGGSAYLTGRDVSATRDLAELTREDQRARERPTVLLHSASYEQDNVRLSLTNVGLGPAVNIVVMARLTTPDLVVSTDWWRVAAILPGSNVTSSVEIDVRVRDLDRSDVEIRVEGTYTDRRRMENYHVLTNVQTGPLASPSE
jgi:hypothetical protein